MIEVEGTTTDKQGSSAEKNVIWAKALEPEVLYFTLGGRELTKLSLHALTLTIPFTQLNTDIEANVPPWNEFPSDIDAAVVPAQPVAADPPRLTILPHAIRYVASCSNRYFVDLQGSFPAYLQKFSANPRNDITRAIRRFAECSGGQIEWRELRSPDEMSEFRNLAVEVSPKTWQEGTGGPGFPRGKEFEKAIVNLATEGLVRGYVLFHRSRPISYALCLACDDVLLFARTAYDQDYASRAPGKVLLYLVLERLFAEGTYRYFDFGEGTLPYKQLFSTDHIRCARMIYCRRNFNSFVIAASHCTLSSFSRGVGRVLKAVNLKGRVKGLLMGELRRPGQ